jgi:hypothetical protein
LGDYHILEQLHFFIREIQSAAKLFGDVQAAGMQAGRHITTTTKTSICMIIITGGNMWQAEQAKDKPKGKAKDEQVVCDDGSDPVGSGLAAVGS